MATQTLPIPRCMNNYFFTISLLGHIALMMTVRHKVTYLFTMIPSQPSTSWFKSLDSIITKFYWKNKTPRFKLTTLQKPKTHRGLTAPNFYNYYLANQLQYILKWIHLRQSHSTWLDIEQAICNNITISDLPFLSQTIKQRQCLTISASLVEIPQSHKLYIGSF